MNRLTKHIDGVREKIAPLDAERVRALDEGMSLIPSEHFAYQEMQASAHARGLISLDEAQLVYSALGESCSPTNGGWSAGVDTATKVSVTALMGELVRAR